MHILHILEWNRGHKAWRAPRPVDLGVKFVNLFERQTLRLINHAPDEKNTDEAAATPDKEDFGAKVGVTRVIVYKVGGSTIWC